MKTVDAVISYVFNINVSALYVSAISSGHHEALMKITQVIKLLVITELNSMFLVRKQTIPNERPPLVGEVSAATFPFK
jgi:hypothetical protein